MLMERGADRGYFSKLAKSLFISDTPGQVEAAKREFEAEVLTPNFGSESGYMGSYLGLQEELAAWVKPQV